MVKAKLAALTRNAGAVLPEAAPMTSPATAGPTSRALLKMVELRPTALVSRSGPTISETNACRTGASIAETEPRAAASTKTCQSSMASEATSSPSTRATTPMRAWVARSTRRLA
jgi:hypothetical protein